MPGSQITKPEMLRLIERELVKWPPIVIGTELYAWRIESEDQPGGLVWCTI